MGCDIHIVLEQRMELNGVERWVGIDTFRAHTRRDWRDNKWTWSYPIPTERNYALFARLAGVRGEGPEPKGVPDDASETTLALVEAWGEDGHSHSWATLADAAEAYVASATDPENLLLPDDPRMKDPYDFFFNVDRDEADKFRIVFWFDN